MDYYERIKDLNLGELYYEQACICYRYLGQKDKVLEVIKRWAKSKLWDVASPTQVRPMSFFMYPFLHEYLENEESLKELGKLSSDKVWIKIRKEKDERKNRQSDQNR